MPQAAIMTNRGVPVRNVRTIAARSETLFDVGIIVPGSGESKHRGHLCLLL